MRSLAVVSALAAMLAGLLQPQNRAGEKRFVLRGTVVDGVSHRPLPNVELELQDDKFQPAAEPVNADGKGQFLIRGLAAGEYILSVRTPGYGTVHYNELPDPAYVSTLRVGPDKEEKSIVFQVMPRGVIEGVVRDSFGEPMERATVFVLRPVWNNGRTVLRQLGQKFTDDRGHYRFADALPGSYLICTGGPGGNTPVPVAGPVDFAVRPEPRYYTRTCYPDANSASYLPSRLAPGQHAQIDLTPLTVSAVSVRGRVLNVPPKIGFTVLLAPEELFDSGRQSLSAFVDPAQGTFAFRGVQPGNYRLRADIRWQEPGGTPKALTAGLPVNVGSSDMDGLDLSLESGAALDVVVHGLTENHLDPTSLTVSLRHADSMGHPELPLRGDDGSYHFKTLPPDNYWLVTRTQASVCVQSVRLGDREVRGSTLKIALGPPVRLDVTVSKDCGAIQVRAVLNGEPMPTAKVVLLLSGTAQNPGDLIEDYTNDQGEVSFEGLTPGRYLVWAWAVDGAFPGPGSLAEVEQQATPVDVKPGAPAKIDVPLLKREGEAR